MSVWGTNITECKNVCMKYKYYRMSVWGTHYNVYKYYRKINILWSTNITAMSVCSKVCVKHSNDVLNVKVCIKCNNDTAGAVFLKYKKNLNLLLFQE